MTVTPLAPRGAAADPAATPTSSPIQPTTSTGNPTGTVGSARRRQRKPAHERAAVRAARTNARLDVDPRPDSPSDRDPSAVAVSGVFEAHRRGFGFLRLRPGPGAPAGVESIYVPRHLNLGLLTGDELRAHATCTRGRWQLSAIDTVRRLPVTVVARLAPTADLPARVEAEFGHAFVQVPAEVAADHSIWPGGRRVLVTLAAHTSSTRALDQGQPLRASAFTVLQDPMTPAELREVTFLAHGLRLSAPWEDLPAASAPAPTAPVDRLDLTEVPTFTIDAASSRDLDDAISAHATPGGIRVQVHIADVAHAIALNSPLDLAAREAATSVYLPGWNRPMLPRELSEDALSLLPLQVRETLTVSYTVACDGTVSDIDLAPTRIRSDRRLTYTEASDIVAAAVTSTDPVVQTLLAAHTAAEALGQQRQRRATLGDRARPTPDWQPALHPVAPQTTSTLGDDPYSQAAFIRGQAKPATAADTLIERLMVAANEAVASWLLAHNLPGVFRTHAEPGVGLIADITACVATLPPALRRTWTQERAFVELHASLDEESSASPMTLLSQFAALDPGPEHQALVEQLWFRHLRKAQYQTAVGGHHGLGSQGYTHFTSPIRRYADLAIHHVIHAHLADDPAKLADIRQVLDSGLCVQLNLRNCQASRIERDVVSYATRQLLTRTPATDPTDRTEPGEAVQSQQTLRAVVIGVGGEGVEVELPQVGLRAVIAPADLECEYKFYAHGLFAKNLRTGSMLRLGSRLEVRVETHGDGEALHLVPVRARVRRRSRRKGTSLG